tara:strand:- start:162 stop:782 length:621 start_codon:yes stop_codon:yes gene_type:complete
MLRRPLVLSGAFVSEADNNDAVPILGSIFYGSGLNNQQFSFEQDSTAFVTLAPEASGLLFDGLKLGDDGQSLSDSEAALVDANAALATVNPALLSGIAAAELAVDALASGNAALLANASGIQLADAANRTALVALASGEEAVLTATASQNINNMKLQNSINVLGTCSDANVDAVHALSSGNAALTILATNPFIDENQLVGLIFGLS